MLISYWALENPEGSLISRDKPSETRHLCFCSFPSCLVLLSSEMFQCGKIGQVFLPYQQGWKYSQFFRSMYLLDVLRQHLGHQQPPGVERGWCVLCAEFLAGTSGQFSKERRNTEENTALSLSAESLFVSLCLLPHSLEIISPNGSGVGHLLWLFLFFYSSSIHSPISVGRKRDAVSVWKVDGRDGSICSLSGKVLSGTLSVEEIKEQRVVKYVCMCSIWIQPASASIYCPDPNNTRHLNFNQVGCWFCPS